MRARKRQVMRGVPVLREHDVLEQRRDAMDHRNHFIAAGHRQRPAGQKSFCTSTTRRTVLGAISIAGSTLLLPFIVQLRAHTALLLHSAQPAGKTARKWPNGRADGNPERMKVGEKTADSSLRCMLKQIPGRLKTGGPGFVFPLASFFNYGLYTIFAKVPANSSVPIPWPTVTKSSFLLHWLRFLHRRQFPRGY